MEISYQVAKDGRGHGDNTYNDDSRSSQPEENMLGKVPVNALDGVDLKVDNGNFLACVWRASKLKPVEALR